MGAMFQNAWFAVRGVGQEAEWLKNNNAENCEVVTESEVLRTRRGKADSSLRSE
jgi:hypothetical protein